MSERYENNFWWNASLRPYVAGYLDNNGFDGPLTGVEGGYFLKLKEKQLAGHSKSFGVELLTFAEVDPQKTEHWALGLFARIKKYYTYASFAAGTGLTIRNLDPRETDPSYGFLLDAEFGTLADAFIVSPGVSIYPAADSRKYVGTIKIGFDVFKLMGAFDTLSHAGN